MTQSKELVLKLTLSTALAGVLSYFNQLLIPLAMLLFVMVCDYCTGILSAWCTRTLSSRIGVVGIVKKVGYFFAVCVAGGADWLIQSGCSELGITLPFSFTLGALVIIWLILNECLSILENLAAMGVPLPAFLTAVTTHLKQAVEQQGDRTPL